MLFDDVLNHGKNRRIDSMPDQFYGDSDGCQTYRRIENMLQKNVYSFYRGKDLNIFGVARKFGDLSRW